MEVSFRPREWVTREISALRVSILVLMEVSFRHTGRKCHCPKEFSFNPCFNGSIFQTVQLLINKVEKLEGFNPCFNGSIFQTNLYGHWIGSISVSFNPCFNGSIFQTQTEPSTTTNSTQGVSILVLMEVSFRQGGSRVD